jgi:hypothetical protein
MTVCARANTSGSNTKPSRLAHDEEKPSSWQTTGTGLVAGILDCLFRAPIALPGRDDRSLNNRFGRNDIVRRSNVTGYADVW